jgi:starvation-inducible outer membrane lipoprotein
MKRTLLILLVAALFTGCATAPEPTASQCFTEHDEASRAERRGEEEGERAECDSSDDLLLYFLMFQAL